MPPEAPRQVFILMWPDRHWGVFLPDRYSTSSSGKLWHVNVADMKVKPGQRQRQSWKWLRTMTPCSDKIVDFVKEGHVLKTGKYKTVKVEDAFATESVIDSIAEKIAPKFNYEVVHENCQTFVVEVMRELVSRGSAPKEAIEFVRGHSLTSVRVAAWNRERRHPLPDTALDHLGPRAPRVDFPSSSHSRESSRALKNSSPGLYKHQNINITVRRREEHSRAAEHVRCSSGSAGSQQARGNVHRYHVREAAHFELARQNAHRREKASYGRQCDMPGALVE